MFLSFAAELVAIPGLPGRIFKKAAKTKEPLLFQLVGASALSIAHSFFWRVAGPVAANFSKNSKKGKARESQARLDPTKLRNRTTGGEGWDSKRGCYKLRRIATHCKSRRSQFVESIWDMILRLKRRPRIRGSQGIILANGRTASELSLLTNSIRRSHQQSAGERRRGALPACFGDPRGELFAAHLFR